MLDPRSKRDDVAILDINFTWLYSFIVSLGLLRFYNGSPQVNTLYVTSVPGLSMDDLSNMVSLLRPPP